MPVTRVSGNITPKFTLKIGSAAAIDFSDQLISVALEDGEGAEAVTFADFATGYAPLQFSVEALFSFDATAFYKFLWENSGVTGVAFVYNRWGLATPTTTKPNLVGTLSIPAKIGFSAEASESDVDTFEGTLQIDGTPTWATS